ncbi:MAG: HD domain-containing protein, partial [Deltaproteobacteria bacterium]|nr:HD domain-containing protein [Deltaproteobacteria bacterium]
GILKLLEVGSREAALRAARRFLPKVVRSIARVHDLSAVDRVVVVSTDVFHFVTGLAKVVEKPWGLELSRRAYDRLVHRIGPLSSGEVAEISQLDRAAADLACMAFEELRAFVAPCHFKSILLPRCSMLDSVMLDRALDLDDEAGVAARNLPATVEASAWAVARKYRISESHVKQVRSLSLELFDGLRGLTGLDGRARLLLSVAAILHDIGIFVGTYDHERHSAYLIRNSEVMGLDSAELARVALVVRYHRHPFRDIETRDLGPLSSPERVEVLKLTAILRIADALDTNHFRRVVRLRVAMTHDELQVTIETRAGDREGFFDLQRAFDEKADLAEEVFGMKLTLTEVLAA